MMVIWFGCVTWMPAVSRVWWGWCGARQRAVVTGGHLPYLHPAPWARTVQQQPVARTHCGATQPPPRLPDPTRLRQTIWAGAAGVEQRPLLQAQPLHAAPVGRIQTGKVQHCAVVCRQVHRVEHLITNAGSGRKAARLVSVSATPNSNGRTMNREPESSKPNSTATTPGGTAISTASRSTHDGNDSPSSGHTTSPSRRGIECRAILSSTHSPIRSVAAGQRGIPTAHTAYMGANRPLATRRQFVCPHWTALRLQSCSTARAVRYRVEVLPRGRWHTRHLGGAILAKPHTWRARPETPLDAQSHAASWFHALGSVRRPPRAAAMGMAAQRPLRSTAASAPRMAGWLSKAMPIAARAGPASRTAVTAPMVVRRAGDPVASRVPKPKPRAENRKPASSAREPSSATTSLQLPSSMPASTIRNVTLDTLTVAGCQATAVSVV